MGWIPGFMEWDEEERRNSPDGLSPLDITYGDFGGGGGGKGPKSKWGWLWWLLSIVGGIALGLLAVWLIYGRI